LHAAQNAKQQGLTITLPGGSTYDLGNEQGRRVTLPKEQSYTTNDLEDFLNGTYIDVNTMHNMHLVVAIIRCTLHTICMQAYVCVQL
jgi:hypothetical protein